MNNSTDVQRFNAHLDRCRICRQAETRALCNIGIELLFEAEDDLDVEWQRVARILHEQDRLERDANANFEYYKGADEP